MRRTGITTAQAEALATAGALGCFSVTAGQSPSGGSPSGGSPSGGSPSGGSMSRREALWAAGALAQAGPALDAVAPALDAVGDPTAGGRRRSWSARLPGLVTGVEPPQLPEMSPVEVNRADLWAIGLSPDSYPTEFIRADLMAAGVVTSAGLMGVSAGDKVRVAGMVTHRQRPATASGTTFLNLEDETGLINVVCSKGAWTRYRRVARSAPALIIDGRLERVEEVINVIAERIQALPLTPSALRSRDFR